MLAENEYLGKIKTFSFNLRISILRTPVDSWKSYSRQQYSWRPIKAHDKFMSEEN